MGWIPFAERSILTKLMLLVASVMAILIISILLLMNSVRRGNVELVGKTAAETLTNQVLVSGRFYTNEILPRTRVSGISASHTFQETDDQLPVPATLLKMQGELFAEQYPGSLVRTYSEYPFIGRKGGIIDDFDATALAAVRAMPSEPYYEIIQKDDQSSIRYVSAMIMSEGCVGCHNSHPDSPKKDWQVGDVRGGLEVIVPIESADAGIRQGTSQLATVVLIGMFLLAGLIWLLLQRTVMNPVGAIITASDKVEAGQFTSRAPVQSRDELGVMAQRFNAMLDRTEQSMLAVRQQNTLLETSVNNLLDDVAQAANGDLTVSADGHHGATHAIGEAFNTMLGQMRRIIQQVQETSLQVNAAAQQIRTKAAQLEEASTHQAVQISSTVNSIESMSASIQEVSANSVHSASIGAQAKVSAERGTQSVEDTIKGMIRLEQQIRDTTIRVETLRGNSLEIGQIVELIEDIADRTMILALNASIQAAKAGPSGASFRVIAEEVERLAKHSADATQQISLLINRNQTETGLLANAISATSAEIEKGSRLARQAGGALKEISTVSEQFAELSQIISQSARHQAHTSASLTDTMHEIADITHRNAAGTRETSASLQNLSRLTTELRESVSIFKVYANGKTRR